MTRMDAVLRPAATETATATGGRTRIVGFDVLRMAALTAVVAFHAGAPGSWYTDWRMPVLTIITTALAAGRRESRPLSEQARRSASRLLVPWLFWCAVYAAIDAFSYFRLGVSIVDELGPRVLLTGPSVHLWYLPFAFVMVLAVEALRRLTDDLSPARTSLPAAAIAVSALVFVALDGSYRDDVGTPWPQWLRVVPAVFLGLAVGIALRRWSGRGLMVVAATAAAACGLVAVALGDHLAACYGLAILLVAAASTCRFTPPRWLTEAAGLAMGVYLVHMVVHRLVFASVRRLPTADFPPIVLSLTVVALSFAAAWAISRTPLRRFV